MDTVVVISIKRFLNYIYEGRFPAERSIGVRMSRNLGSQKKYTGNSPHASTFTGYLTSIIEFFLENEAGNNSRI